MKLIIQIPCLNEAQTLPITLADLPRQINGIDKIEWLIIDDGSSDDTAAIAKQCGVDHIVSHVKNQGLAAAFMTGLNACLTLGADIIINTDADNQYNAADIPNLIAPILEGKADMVIGSRPIESIEHFSPIKKFLQKFGSMVIRKLSGTNIVDAPSGFRALTKNAAMQLNVFSEYTYTLETIIQAGHRNIAITSVPIRVNGDLRPSRLVKSITSYIKSSIITMLRIFVIYKPFQVFISAGLIILLIGFIIGSRFLYFYFFGNSNGHVQSLILTEILMTTGIQTIFFAFIADLLASNRKLLETIKYETRKGSLYNDQINLEQTKEVHNVPSAKDKIQQKSVMF